MVTEGSSYYYYIQPRDTPFSILLSLLEEVVSFPGNPPFHEAWTAIHLARRG